jgi:hypothetical protein
LLSQSVGLPGNTATPEPLRFFRLFGPPSDALRRADRQFGQFAVVHMLVRPKLERWADMAGLDARASRVQALMICPWNCGSSFYDNCGGALKRLQAKA